jgi:hypothetical protein
VQRNAPTSRTVHRQIVVHQNIEQSNKMRGIWSLIDTDMINYIGQFCFGEGNATKKRLSTVSSTNKLRQKLDARS